MQLRLIKILLLTGLFIFPNKSNAQFRSQDLEYQASQHIDAEQLVTVADSFKIPHVIFYALAWQETRRGDFNYRFPRGVGIEVIDSISFDNVRGHFYTHRICKEIGRFQLRPCINWAKILKDPICTNTNLLSIDKHFAYQVNLHCAAKHIASLHTMYSWKETMRHYNGDGKASFIYLDGALTYIGRYHLRLME